MSTSKIDVVGEARKLAEKLSGDNLSIWGTRITDSIETGFTSGEILMAIRWNLQKMLKEEKSLPSDAVRAARMLIDEINETGV